VNIVAVTSCPTGIAHSQMAAESLEQTAERLDHGIAVEIQGAMGAEDELDEGEIENADAAIIAADTSVNQDRLESRDSSSRGDGKRRDQRSRSAPRPRAGSHGR